MAKARLKGERHKNELREHGEQVALFAWAELTAPRCPELYLLFAIPNGARVATIGTARKLVAEGLKRGVPDMFLPVARAGFHGLFIELKAAVKPAPLRATQEGWRRALLNQGYAHFVCKGYEEAKSVLMTYLGGQYDRRTADQSGVS